MGSIGRISGRLRRVVMTMTAGAMQRALARRRAQVLCFHSLPVEQDVAFRQLVQRLRDGHELVSYGEALRRILEGRLRRPTVAFTFDDGLKSQLRAAAALEDAGVRGCFFVCLDGLNAARGRAGAFCRRRLRSDEDGLMDWSDVEELLRRGHEVGCHSATHANLAELVGSQLDEEVGRAAQELRRRLGTVLHFAWPWGRWQHFSADARRRVTNAGFVSCASCEAGCHRFPAPAAGELCVRRLSVDLRDGAAQMWAEMGWAALGRGLGDWPSRLARAAGVDGWRDEPEDVIGPKAGDGAPARYTVMTPVYNGAGFIRRCYYSLCRQTVRDWEWVVVNDGSTDGTLDILRQIAAADDRVRVVSYRRNRGRAYARTRAMAHGRGQWLVVWDADDFYLPERLAHIDQARREGFDYYVSRTAVVDESLALRGHRDFGEIFPGASLRTGDHAAMALRMDLARRLGYMPHLRTYGGIGEDVAIIFGAASLGRGYFDPEPMLVNMIGNEIVLPKSIDANRVRVAYWRGMYARGELDVSERVFRKMLRRERLKMSILQALRVLPAAYRVVMRVMKRGRATGVPGMSTTVGPFLEEIRRLFPPPGVVV